MKIVLDTNVLLAAISTRSKYHAIYRAIIEGTVQLAMSNSIAEEYEEIIGRFYGPFVAENVVNSLLKSPFVHLADPRFQWLLVKDDPDDDKFADCAIIVSADYIVTNDRHFKHLKKLPFPVLKVVNEDEFRIVFENYYGKIT